jgi:hypothetical protein
MKEDIDQLKKDPAIIRLYMQKVRLERQGNRFRGACPFGTHDDSTPSFDIYPDKTDGTLIFKCLGCGASGNILQFISKLEHVSINEAIKVVKIFVSGTPETQAKAVDAVFKPMGQDKPRLVLSLNDIAKYEQALENNLAAQEWLARERGITYQTAKRFHTGYCQDIGKLIGPNDQDVRDKGWIVLPCVEGDKVHAIKFRSLARKVFRRMMGMASEVLYNVDTIDLLEPVFLTEGEFDTMVLEQAGFRATSLPNATCKTTPEMKDKLLRAELVVLAGDTDGAAGSEKMKKLWAELGDRAAYLEWPAGWKDANATFLKECKGNVGEFHIAVNHLLSAAKSVVMPGIYSLQDSMRSHHQTDLANHPERFRFPWKNVDSMAIILPGDVVAVLATNTKMGKTCWLMNATLDAALTHGEVILNYQCELEPDRFNTMVAAYILRKDRNHLSNEDIEQAARRLGTIRYYIGSNPALNTVGPVLDLIEAAIKRTGATVVVLDHIHFICRNASDETKAQADASQRIANMAKRYRVKFFMVEQPRKANQNSRGKRLKISDGKGSEALHSDAAAIFAIHRDEVPVTDPPPPDPLSPITSIHLLGGARSKGDGASEARLIFFGNFAAFNEMVNAPADDQSDGGLFAGQPV